MEKKKILVVDDEAALRKLLEASLNANGYETFSASNGSEGLQKAREERPDLIILDIMMEGQDGTEVGYILKEDVTTKDIPIIFLTGLKTKEEEQESSEEHEYTVLAKPVNTQELIGHIEKILSATNP